MTNMDLTAVCKTFFRPESLNYLLESYGSYQNKTGFIFKEILVGDDSSDDIKLKNQEIIEKFKQKYPDYPIRYINMEFDSGLSKGRNILVENVNSEFFLLLDDDLIFTEKCNIEDQLKLAIEKNTDILGGDFYNLNTKGKKRPIFKTNFFGIFNENKNDFSIYFIYNNYPKFAYCDIINNFFIGKTTSVKQVKWEEELKVGEHEEFFIRAKIKHNLNVAYSNELFIKHYPIRSKEYSVFRNRFSGSNDRANIMKKIKETKILGHINNKNFNELFINKKNKKYSFITKMKYSLIGNDYNINKL